MKSHFDPLERRDAHGKWSKGTGESAIIARADAKARAANAALAQRQQFPSAALRSAAARAEVRAAQRLRAQGYGPETIREHLAQRRQDIANRKLKRDIAAAVRPARSPEVFGGRSDQLRRALSAGNAVPAVRPAAFGGGGMGESTIAAVRHARVQEMDRPSTVPGRWKFIRSGNREVTKPKVGDKARMSLGAAGNQVGTVVAVAGLVAAIDSGDDDMRYVVDWRNGRVRTKIPLSQAGPALPRNPPLRPVPSPPDQQQVLPTNDPALIKLRSITRDDLSKGKTEYPHQGQQGSVEIVRLPDGTEVVHKKYNPGYESMADSDVLAYEVSNAIGAGAPPVNKIGPGEITMGFVPGQMGEDWAWEAAGSDKAPHDLEERMMRSPEGVKIGLLDYLIANPDRHDQNWMVTPDGKPVPIDNSGAWQSPWGTTSDFWDHAPVDPAEYTQVLERIEALEPQFTALDHTDWYMDTISRLNDIAPFAFAAPLSLQVLDLAFNAAELRDERGKWAKFGAVGEAADIVAKNREGFSVSLHTGGEPKQGYMVAQTDHTHVFPETVLDSRKETARAIDEMLMSERSAFEGKDTYLGGWVHGGKLWLEPSDNIANKAEAVRAAAERNQIAIWDVNHGAEIQTGGTGGGRIIEHANAQGDPAHPGWLLGSPGGRAAGGSGEAGRAAPVGLAAQILDFRFDPLELRDERGRWAKGRTEQLSLHKILRAAADPFVGAPMQDEPQLKAAVEKVATPASEIVPKLVGGSRDEWNGKVKLFEYDKQKELLAFMDWDGTMNAASNVAQALQDGESLTDRPVQFPDAFEVIEHELIHGVVPAGSAKRNEKAYQVFSISQIEEGFTELGAIQHAPEFFRQIGMADREAGPWPGHTVGEMAQDMTNPKNITAGNTWGHYDSQVKDAQDWVQQIAKEEGSDPSDRKRLTELADQVNQMGSDGKIPVMAHQLSVAMTHDPKQRSDQHYMDTLDAAIMEAILKQWNVDNPDGAAKQAFNAAKAVATEKQREMAEMGSAA